MTPTDRFFVPRDEMLKLTRGSFEHLSVRVEQAVKSETALFKGEDAEVLGTYSSKVVVLTGEGKVCSVKFEESAAGSLRLISASEMEASVYPRESMPQFLKKEARLVADLYLKGMVGEARRRMEQLAKLVSTDAVVDDKDIVERFLSELERESGWKKVVLDREGEVRRVLGEAEFQGICSKKLRAKFFKLYDGSLSGDELENFRGLVNEDLGFLMRRIEEVRGQTVTAVSRLREAVETVPESKRETVRVFEGFVTELHAELALLPGALSEAVQNIDSVGPLGRLFDRTAEAFLWFEVAGEFASKMSQRLTEAVGQ